MTMRSTPSRLTSLALLALLLPATVALAQDTDRFTKILEHAKERFTAADTDHDGMLTRAEAQKGMPFVAKNFDRIDAGKTGQVSLADITKYIEERRAKLSAAAKAEPKTEPKKDK
ncbi:MAG TPA: hypothetical protein VGH81_08605 [Rudaea sp.]|jgi:hypothetical protein